MASDDHGLDRCLKTVYAAIIALRDCGENDEDITTALKMLLAYGPRQALDEFAKRHPEELGQ
jgi:hypothetical protein